MRGDMMAGDENDEKQMNLMTTDKSQWQVIKIDESRMKSVENWWALLEPDGKTEEA